MPQRKKGINRARKGRELELLAIKVLEARGYTVRRAIRTSIRLPGGGWISHKQDFFGCDLMATKEAEPLLLVQVTTGSISRKRQLLQSLVLPTDQVEIWRYTGGAKGRIHKGTGNPIPAQYFQRFILAEDFAINKSLRIFLPVATDVGETANEIQVH